MRVAAVVLLAAHALCSTSYIHGGLTLGELVKLEAQGVESRDLAPNPPCKVSPVGCFADRIPAPGVPAVRAVNRAPLVTQNLSEVSVDWCAGRCYALGFNYSAITGASRQGQFTCYCDCQINGAAPTEPLSQCAERCPVQAPGQNASCGDLGLEFVYSLSSCDPPLKPASVCPGSGGLPAGPACSQKASKKWPFCNSSLSEAERVADLVSRVALRDAGPLLTARESSAIPSLGLPPFYWGTNAIHGVVNNAKCFGNRCPTTFPNAINLAATFNRSLVRGMGATIGREMRALANLNASHDGLAAWGPTINLVRDPRWGRNQETASEDPLVAGEYGAQFSLGLQFGETGGANGEFLMAAATLKHITAYSLEDYSPSGNHSEHTFTRQNFSAVVSQRDLIDSYLPAFQRAIQEGNAQGVMYSCSELNGVPGIDSAYLAEWLDNIGFDGYRTTDGGQVGQTVSEHHYVDNIYSSIQLAMRDGVSDIDDGGSYSEHLLDTYTKGMVNASIIQRALSNTFKIRFRLGLFDDPAEQPATKLGEADINDARAQALNAEASRESLVLLSNYNKTLPFESRAGKTVVVGPDANSTRLLQGSYGEKTVCPPGATCRARSIFMAIREAVEADGGTAVYMPGMQDTGHQGNDSTLLADAIAAAKTADRVVVVLGLQSMGPSRGGYEGEQYDRFDIGLPGDQPNLVEAMLSLGNHAPSVAFVLVHGGAIAADQLKKRAAAVLDAHYPGMMTGGAAVAGCLFGEFSPSGKLPYTVYPKSFQNASNFTSFSMTESPGRTYRYYRGEEAALWPFGWGLSYSEFELSDFKGVEGTVGPQNQTFACVVTLRNVGGMRAKEVVFLFLRPVSVEGLVSTLVPVQQLLGWQKVELLPGQDSQVRFSLNLPSDIMLVDEKGQAKLFAGKYELTASRGQGDTVSSSFRVAL